MGELRSLHRTFMTALKSMASQREALLLQVALLLASNLIYFSFWAIYFSHFKAVQGWTIRDVAAVHGVVSGGYGLFCVFLGGTRHLPRMIAEGDLDALLVKPRNLLGHIMVSRSIPSGWGDLLSCAVFLTASGYLSWSRLPMVVLFLVSSCLVIAAFSVLTGSLAFWIDDSHALSRQLFEFLLTFSNYPKSIYSGGVKAILMTLIPSAFIGFYPVETLRHPTLGGLLIIMGFSLGYPRLAIWIFQRGLRRYSSGNRMGFKG